jgi:hypothetical protein
LTWSKTSANCAAASVVTAKKSQLPKPDPVPSNSTPSTPGSRRRRPRQYYQPPAWQTWSAGPAQSEDR